jgi:hypothetical protein
MCILIIFSLVQTNFSGLSRIEASEMPAEKIVTIPENEWTGTFDSAATEVIWFMEGVTEIVGMLMFSDYSIDVLINRPLTIILPETVSYIDYDYFDNIKFAQVYGKRINFVAPDGSYIAEFLIEKGYSVSASTPIEVYITDLAENSATLSIPHDPLAEVFDVYYEFDGERFDDTGSDVKIELPDLSAGDMHKITVTKYTDSGYNINSEETTLEFATKGGSTSYGFSGKSLSDSDVKVNVYSIDKYENWAGVSTAQEFNWQGKLGIAYKNGDNIELIQTDKTGNVLKSISLEARYPLLGTVTADENNIYIVYGRANTGETTSLKTIFVSKYDFEGDFISEVGTVGDGDYYYDETFNTKIPFDGGNCIAEISGNVLLVNYAREMYNGHQSNDLFAVDKTSMTEIEGVYFYNSHSFNQDIAVMKNGGFLALSHGDSYPRSFATAVLDSQGKLLNEMSTFNFWVEEGAYDAFDMMLLNKTYAYMGGTGETSAGAVLVGAAAPELTSEAKTSAKQVFVQIFNPKGNDREKSTYVTSGVRTGIAGNNGDVPTTDYGAKWLTTGANTENTIRKIQMTVWNDKIFVFYEKKNIVSGIGGTYYQVLNADGSLLKEHAKLSSEYILNEHEKPVITDDGIQWVYGTENETLKVYTLSRITDDDVTYNLADLIALKKYILGSADISPIDINKDGLITIIDLNILKYNLLKKNIV